MIKNRKGGDEMTQETFKVRVMKIIFRNDDNGYSVMKVRDMKSNNPFFVVGYFFDVDESSKIEVQGCFEESKYGKQLKCESWHPVIPTTIQGIQHYLSGGFIKGIGPVYAEKIVKTFGEDTIEVIEHTHGTLGRILINTDCLIVSFKQTEF